MDLSTYTQSLRRDLTAAAALGDDNTRRIAEALADAAENSARLMVISALSDLAAEVSAELGDRAVHVRLTGNDATVEITGTDRATDPEQPAASTPPGGDGTTGTRPPTSDFDDLSGDISRVTLRLVEQVKARAEEAAAQNGVSLNSWVAQAVQGALSDQMRRSRENTRFGL
ncbi:toxin-antitoxin system HicB family antitoxin [Rhodococcus sp. NPDC058505]|uniref:toxin-antitoxin system HicB family antitoxin n=1 Tax=unclassified Rhodococcus (in: high G+C Gram-positive bacteria) TaxID=192944 RepID=UPI0036697A72